MKGKVKNMMTRTNERRKDNYGGTYKVVEAMYRQEYSNEEITRRIRVTDESTIWDMIQRVFAKDQMRKERP